MSAVADNSVVGQFEIAEHGLRLQHDQAARLPRPVAHKCRTAHGLSCNTMAAPSTDSGSTAIAACSSAACAASRSAPARSWAIVGRLLRRGTDVLCRLLRERLPYQLADLRRDGAFLADRQIVHASVSREVDIPAKVISNDTSFQFAETSASAISTETT
jgi:hypothetical protein